MGTCMSKSSQIRRMETFEVPISVLEERHDTYSPVYARKLNSPQTENYLDLR
jgi:hypothetical protein